MSARARVAALLVAALLLLPPGVAYAGPVVPPIPSAALDARIDAYLARERQSLGLPGVALAVVRDGRVEHLAALGDAGRGRSLTPQTPVLLASLSKGLTAVAVMQLVESGRLALDAPVVRYLPWFSTRDRGQSAQITVAQLLHQTSGLPEHYPAEAGLVDDRGPDALEHEVRAMDEVELIAPPGTGFVYANANYVVLGLLVQTISGQRFADYLDEHVFAPAGMRHTYATRERAAAAGVSDPYYRWFGLVYLPTPSIPEPAGLAPAATMWGSAEDLACELLLHLDQGTVDGRSVLSPGSMAELHRPTAEVNVANAYAMGWYVRPAWEQSSPRSFGASYQLPFVWEHGGSWSTASTYLGFIPDRHLGIAVLINGNDPPAESALGNIHRNVWHLLAGTPMEGATRDEPLLLRYSWPLALALVALLAASLGWSLGELRRRGRDRPAGRASRRAVVVPLALDLAVLVFVWVYVPVHQATSSLAIIRGAPDLGFVMIVVTLVAVLWGGARTILLLRPDRRG